MKKSIEQLLDEIKQLKALRDNRIYKDCFDELQAKIEILQDEYYTKIKGVK